MSQSDLDADLYGDLYGNDDSEFAVPIEPQEDIPKADPEEVSLTEKAAPPTSKPAEPTAPESKIPTVSTLDPAIEQPSPAVEKDASTIPSYTSPPTQQIPTYQERQEPDYSQLQGGHNGTYQGVGNADRPVRPSEMKEEGKMFIGGLNWDTTDESLRKYFSQFGKVEACTIMRDNEGRSRCFAFLTFEEPASVNAVMVREHFLDGKIIDPKRAIPRQEHQRATKLFIGGLAGSVTSESMREFFSQYGKVVDATVMLDRETGRSKGFGFVSFENANVEPLLGFGNLEIDGKLIDVKLAQPRSQRETFAEGGSMGRGRGFNNAGGYGGAQGANFGGASVAPVQGAAAGNQPFDPQALASLYSRMMAQMSGMNPMMGGGMGSMIGGMGSAAAGYGGGMGPGMRMTGGMGNPQMTGATGVPGMSMAGGMGGGQGMGRGGGVMQNGVGPNVPRGPRGQAGGAPPMGPAGVGPQRAGQRGQHSYHPYAR